MKKKRTDLIVMGQIGGAHGVRGDVRVRSYTAEPDMLFAYGPLLSDTGEVLLDPKKVRPVKDHYIVTPETPLQKEAWDALKGSKLYISRTLLPQTEDDEFYIEDLVGLDVFAGGETPVGRVKAVLNHGAGDLLEIHLQTARQTVLIPFTLLDVPTVNIALKRLIVSDIELWTRDADADEKAATNTSE